LPAGVLAGLLCALVFLLWCVFSVLACFLAVFDGAVWGIAEDCAAATLNLSVYTVDAHRGRIMEKLNLHSVAELVRFAVRKGLVD
jgi:hypothetical protein